MIALLTALALAGSAPPAPPIDLGHVKLGTPLAVDAAHHPPNIGDLLFGPKHLLGSQLDASNFAAMRLRHCDGYTQLTTSHAKAALHKLGDLPDADMEIAVNRIGADGCPVPTIAAYRVSR